MDLAARVDHRSLEAQGIDREPTPSIPGEVFYAERRSGIRSAAGDAIRGRPMEVICIYCETGTVSGEPLTQRT